MSIFNFTVDDLTLPISQELITGIDPRSDISPGSTYFLLKDVRNSARANERKALIDEESVSSVISEWLPILEQVPMALIEHCKDLEFTAWYIEALCRQHGFKGLTFGFQLATKLIETYWDDLFPIPEDGDLSERIAPLVGLNGIAGEGALIAPIKAIYITDGVEPYSTWRYEQACEVDRLDSDKQQKKFSAGVISLAEVQKSIKETTKSFYLEIHQDIESTMQAFSALSAAMDSAMLGDPQPTSYIRKCLESCSIAVKHIAKDILAEDKFIAVEESAPVKNEADNANSSDVCVLNKQIKTRDQALKTLDDIAKFFRKTEPHSPMSYAIEQVVRWSELSLPELLQELIVDGDARNGFFKLSGIKAED
ncbi:type VI secretion system protein TssA [Psychromonas antarctica]|uniref:type VI secretion system protein TssA n=1 Tax=Psychromonas antarctica TaxID=67573 RepID=UPI001EE84FEE|nr:type VI secretion system protein TssA [Psychromonas antarctica]MCG6202899.1 type VI secretion system protein TssA [Psychromonas antarctica]